MNSLRIKRNIMLSGANPVRGYLRTSSGEPPLTLTDTYPDKLKVTLYGKSTQASGTYYTANHTITEEECNYSTRKLYIAPYYDGYTGNFYVYDGFAYWCFSVNVAFSTSTSEYYIDCLREGIYEVDYNNVETNLNIAVTSSSTIPSGYTDFSSYITSRTGNVYLFGGTPCSFGAVNGKYANFAPDFSLISGTVLYYDSYAPSLVYRQPSESVDTAITFTEGTTATGQILTAQNVTSYTYPDPTHPQEIVSPTAGGKIGETDIVITKDGQPVTLYGLPVSSGGNVTIGGQQYLSDVLTDNGDGTATVERRIDKITMNGAEEIKVYTYNGMNGVQFADVLPTIYNRAIGKCSHSDKIGSYYTSNSVWVGVSSRSIFWIGALDLLGFSADASGISAFKTWLSNQYSLGTPFNICYLKDIPATETVTITKNKAMNGTTIITSDCPYVGAEYYSWEES